MISLETFKKILDSYINFMEYDEYAIIDAYNHLEITENGYKTNILGFKIWINKSNDIYNSCAKFMINPPKNLYGVDNIYLNEKIKELFGEEYVRRY